MEAVWSWHLQFLWTEFCIPNDIFNRGEVEAGGLRQGLLVKRRRVGVSFVRYGSSSCRCTRCGRDRWYYSGMTRFTRREIVVERGLGRGLPVM